MSITGRLSKGKVAPSRKNAFLASHSGADIVRQSRIVELRRLVASGRYKVQEDKLALSILVRALRR